MDNPEQQNNVPLNGIVADTLKAMTGFFRKALIVRGILFLILGLLMLFRPGRMLLFITIAAGVLILIDGIALLVSALKYRGQGKFFFVLNGALVILLGFFTCTAPLMMNVIWITMIGFWQLFSGVQCLSFRLSAGSPALLSGICGIIAGLFLIFMPLFGMAALMWITGSISFLCGLSAILLGIRLKKILK